MWFANFTIIIIILIFVWVLWRNVIVPILEAKGIEVDEDKSIETDHTKQLEELKKQFNDLSASAQAAEEGLNISRQIKALEARIKEADGERKKL